MELTAIVAMLPVALSTAQTIGGIIAQMVAAGQTTATAEQAALLQQSFATLQSADTGFNTQFADVLPPA